MTDQPPLGRAVRPLWLMTTAAAIAAAATSRINEAAAHHLEWALLLAGAAALWAALSRGRNSPAILWFTAGLALVGGRGLDTAGERLSWQRLVADDSKVVRARVVVVEGWTESRWGWRTRARVVARGSESRDALRPGQYRIEVRTKAGRADLPPPGAEIETLARPSGGFDSPLLVVSSPRLLRDTGRTRRLPAFRDRSARALIRAAGTDVARIRSAELAAALALGRRDLITPERRDHWRRSGFAHLLAVSGLHVGVVGGALWLVATLLGASPRTARVICLAAIPSYAVLTGASPSALRAALMFVIYLGARFLGRAVVPMGAVLLATLLLLLRDPGMIVQPGFQLTVLITAALVRWVPPFASALPGPVWLTGAVAVPLVAQIAAAPIVAVHFRSLIPGAFAANLLAMPLLPAVVLLSLAAALAAGMSAAGSAAILTAIGCTAHLLEVAGTAARARELVAPAHGPLAVALLVALALLALQAGRRARWAAAGWVAAVLAINSSSVLPLRPHRPTFEALPVSDGTAVLMSAGRDAVLADTGRYRRQAAVLAADAGRRRLAALVISHTDEDHAGGAAYVLRALEVERLVVASWLLAEKESVPLLRAARSAGTRLVPVARGTAIKAGGIRMTVLWPPASTAPRRENERSLVARAELGPVTGLVTSDIGRSTEIQLARTSYLASDVLIVPHHGSRESCTSSLLEAVSPAVALVPASPGNTYGHPHREVLARLAARRIEVQAPSETAPARAQWDGDRWIVTGRY